MLNIRFLSHRRSSYLQTRTEKWLLCSFACFSTSLTTYDPLDEALHLDGFKIRLSDDGLTVHGLDKDTQQKVTDSWLWKELF